MSAKELVAFQIAAIPFVAATILMTPIISMPGIEVYLDRFSYAVPIYGMFLFLWVFGMGARGKLGGTPA